MKIPTIIKQTTLMMAMPFSIIASVGALSSCENDGFYYQDEARVRLEGPEVWALGSDSLVFSFVTYPEETSEYVMDIDVCVMGPVSDHDRTASIIVNADATTASASQYSLPATVTVPAGQNKGTLPVTIKRDASMQEKSVRLQVAVAQSNDFNVGVNEQNHFTIIWNDQISRPSNWDTLEDFFGTYSNVKYRFMLSNSEEGTEFSTETMTWSKLNSYRIKFAKALEEYNNAHPGNPLTDENNQLVSF